MKIITDGREKTFLKQCNLCRTDFEYTLEDVECKDTEDESPLVEAITEDNPNSSDVLVKMMKVMGMIPKKSNAFVKCPVCSELIEADFYEKGAMSVPNYGMVGMGR